MCSLCLYQYLDYATVLHSVPRIRSSLTLAPATRLHSQQVSRAQDKLFLIQIVYLWLPRVYDKAPSIIACFTSMLPTFSPLIKCQVLEQVVVSGQLGCAGMTASAVTCRLCGQWAHCGPGRGSTAHGTKTVICTAAAALSAGCRSHDSRCRFISPVER